MDVPHAAQPICQIGEAVLGADHASLRAWQTRKLHQLKHEGPRGVLASLATFAAAHLSVPLVAENLAYLEKREAQMQYPAFQTEGWPIGSGIVESANKLVVEARLKGAGMHWSRMSVNPLLALRNAVCTDRWAEAWQQSAAQIGRNGIKWREVQAKTEPQSTLAPAVQASPATVASEMAEPVTRRKPDADHPWRRKNRATKAELAAGCSQAKL